jgi:hypothetical protein
MAEIPYEIRCWMQRMRREAQDRARAHRLTQLELEALGEQDACKELALQRALEKAAESRGN